MQRLVYALSSLPGDLFAETAAVSATSVRRAMPDARIELLLDHITAKHLHGSRAKVRDLADAVHTVRAPMDRPLERSRYLKTVMRVSVPGDWLYLDADTVVTAPLDEIWTLADEAGADIAAAPDRALPPARHRQRDPQRWLCKQLGWTFPPPREFHAAVLLMRDTPLMHRLSIEWHRRWRQSSTLEVYSDQLPLNTALANMSDVSVLELPDHLNPTSADSRAITRRAVGPHKPAPASLGAAAGSHVLHFNDEPSAGDNSQAAAPLQALARTVRDTGRVDGSRLDHLIELGQPATQPTAPAPTNGHRRPFFSRWFGRRRAVCCWSLRASC